MATRDFQIGDGFLNLDDNGREWQVERMYLQEEVATTTIVPLAMHYRYLAHACLLLWGFVWLLG
jgi:hypothetical protein